MTSVISLEVELSDPFLFIVASPNEQLRFTYKLQSNLLSIQYAKLRYSVLIEQYSQDNFLNVIGIRYNYHLVLCKNILISSPHRIFVLPLKRGTNIEYK